jgi:hypothetical protein
MQARIARNHTTPATMSKYTFLYNIYDLSTLQLLPCEECSASDRIQFGFKRDVNCNDTIFCYVNCSRSN